MRRRSRTTVRTLGYTARVERARFILASVLAMALLSPVFALALPCQPGGMATGACCRQMHSTCMQGEHAGSYACCHKIERAPAQTALRVNPDLVGPAPLAVAVVLLSIHVPHAVRAHASAATAASPPIALYTLHTALLI